MNCTLLDTGKITIGDNTLVGPDVKIYTAMHPLSARERLYTDESGKTAVRTKTAPVVIGHNVWIGGGAIILPGVSIGDNSVVGAGSVVVKSIPANAVACGTPAQLKRCQMNLMNEELISPHIYITMIPGRGDKAKKEIAVKEQQLLAKELNIDEKFISVSIENVEKKIRIPIWRIER